MLLLVLERVSSHWELGVANMADVESQRNHYSFSKARLVTGWVMVLQRDIFAQFSMTFSFSSFTRFGNQINRINTCNSGFILWKINWNHCPTTLMTWPWIFIFSLCWCLMSFASWFETYKNIFCFVCIELISDCTSVNILVPIFFFIPNSTVF